MTHVEKRAYCNVLNAELRGDPELKAVLPINPSSDGFFRVIAEGKILSKLIKKYWPKKFTNIPLTLDGTIKAAKDLGISVHVTLEELKNGIANQEIVVEFVWQILKAHLVDFAASPDDLKRILQPNEKLQLLKPEVVLTRWFNFHLNNHGHHRTVSNFSSDIKDAENYAVLLSQLAKDTVTPDNLIEAFREKDFLKRSELVLRWAAKLGCRKFVAPQDIVEGNEKLNFAFVATLFKRYPKLGPTSDERVSELQQRIDEADSLYHETLLDKEDLRNQIAQTQLDFDTLNVELGELKIEYTGMCNERDSLRKEKTSLEGILGELNKQNTSLKTELNDLTTQKDSLFAELEAEISQKLDLETLLKETNAEYAQLDASSKKEISELQKILDNEVSEKDNIATQLEQTMREISDAKVEAAKAEAELTNTLQNTIKDRQAAQSKLDAAKSELQDTLRQAEEAERSKDELFNLLSSTVSELETTKANAVATEQRLRQVLADETAKKESAKSAYEQKCKEYEDALAAWAVERADLLAQISALEAEIDRVLLEMQQSLERIAREKAEALSRVLADRERALLDAQNERDLALDKVRMLLTGNTKQGFMMIYESTLVGMQWKKRFFILRDNLFCWFGKEKHVLAGRRPKGVFYCEEVRVYEVAQEDAKKEFSFQVDNEKVRVNLAAPTLQDMKEWMNEIRVAKKKKLGVKVVSDQKNAK